MIKLIYLGNQLSKHGFTPTSVETVGERLKADFQVIQASSKKNKLLRLFHMWWVVFANNNADYLLLDTYSTSAFMYAWTASRLAKLLGIKYVPILHGGDLPLKAKKEPERIAKFLSEAYCVVSPSGYLKTEMETIIGGDIRYKVIPNYIDIANYSYQKKALNVTEGVKLFWLRSFHKIYNPSLAVKIVHELIEKGYQNVELCMVGPDKDGTMAEVKALAHKLGVADQLKLTGRLTKKEWISLSDNYNLFINTTNVDNTPVSVMEAMALGFPVISTNVGGIPYLFEDKTEGFMVPPDNASAFVNTIIELYNNPNQLETISVNARSKAEHWDWSSIKLLWKEVLN